MKYVKPHAKTDKLLILKLKPTVFAFRCCCRLVLLRCPAAGGTLKQCIVKEIPLKIGFIEEMKLLDIIKRCSESFSTTPLICENTI